ncbi:MAG: response regulator transcription factor [Candidatus Nanopelagicaceae bacterium]|nr:response regulator transcription factor [Candidatus Nanopelagicaceae bacterium]
MKSTGVQDHRIRVLVIDDHPIFRLGVCERINTIGERVVLVGEGEDGVAAHRLAGELTPHVILMDLQMPVMAGIEATSKIKADFPEIQIIILSADDEINDVNAALQAGASGYLLKSVSGLELQEAIFTVIDGGSVLSPTVARGLLTELRQPVGTTIKLSEREIQILKMVATGATNKSISNEIFLSTRTVEAHIHKIFQKLGVSTRTEAVTTAIRKGLIENAI